LLKTKKTKWSLDKAKDGKLTEISVINNIYKLLNKDSVVAVDVGQHQMWTAQRFPGKQSRKFLTSGGLGTMGFSLPTAVGASFSGFETWSIIGDGGFQMNIQELGTIAQDNIPVKIIILNNSFLGMVRQWQELFYEKNYVDTPLKNPNFKKIGEAYGIPSFQVKTREETSEVLEKMKNHKGPILCEFIVEKEENVFPMVPAGIDLGGTLLNATDKIDKL
jgi:acetolactate synthase-1/2/3 large subunit